MNIQTLLKTNVNEHTEKKNNLTYLSWSWAWAEALKADPTATYKVEMFDDINGYKSCYMDINGTAMVFVTVTIFGKPMTCQLPVMNYKNQAILNPDAFQVNTAIMRCMTKALSLHGLGLYIYAGEDLPTDDAASKPVAKISATQGAWEALKPDRQAVVQAVLDAIMEKVAADDMYGAYEEYIGIEDGDEKIALWSKLDSKVRSAIKKQAELAKENK